LRNWADRLSTAMGDEVNSCGLETGDGSCARRKGKLFKRLLRYVSDQREAGVELQADVGARRSHPLDDNPQVIARAHRESVGEIADDHVFRPQADENIGARR
jgi:hypothetical protein